MLVKAPFHNQTRDIIAAAIDVHRVLGPGLRCRCGSEGARHSHRFIRRSCWLTWGWQNYRSVLWSTSTSISSSRASGE